MAERKRGLGRGLGALIPSAPVEKPSSESSVQRNDAGGAEAPPAGSAAAQSESTVAADTAAVNASDATESNDSRTDRPGRVKSEAARSGTGAPQPEESKSSSPKGARSKTGAATGASSKSGTAASRSGKASTAPKSSKKKESGATTAAGAPVSEADAKATAVDPKHTESSGSAEEETSSVSRGTGGRRRPVSASARQSAMKSRMDMGAALQNRGGSGRPSDMFFTPTPSSAESAESADSPDEASDQQESVQSAAPAASDATTEVHTSVTEPSEGATDADRTADVSRGTSGANAEGVEPDAVAAETPATAAELPADSDTSDLASVPGAAFAEVPVGSIHPNRKQPRQVFDEDELAELAYSIGELGVLQPIVVRPSREPDGQPYELVMGERRWRATQRAGLDTVPAIVRDTADDDLLRDALLENLHRSQLNPLEEAAAYQQLLEEFGATQEELSRRIGRSRPQISNTLRLMRLPPLVQRRVAAGVLSAGHARALLALEDPAEMERLAQRIVAEGMSVRAAEEAASMSKRGKPGRRPAARAQERHRERLDYIADAFSDKLDTSVKINLGARKGRMTIEFASVEDLNRIISVLDPQTQDAAQED